MISETAVMHPSFSFSFEYSVTVKSFGVDQKINIPDSFIFQLFVQRPCQDHLNRAHLKENQRFAVIAILLKRAFYVLNPSKAAALNPTVHYSAQRVV